MPRKSEAEEIRSEVEEYLRPVLENMATDTRPINLAAIARQYRRSRQTYYTHGLVERIKCVAEERERVQRGRNGKPKPELQQKLEEARQDARHWEGMYREVLGKLTILEAYFLNHPSVDVDALYERGLSKPDRSAPASPRRLSSRRG
jgi:hypothetical protein